MLMFLLQLVLYIYIYIYIYTYIHEYKHIISHYSSRTGSFTPAIPPPMPGANKWRTDINRNPFEATPPPSDFDGLHGNVAAKRDSLMQGFGAFPAAEKPPSPTKLSTLYSNREVAELGKELFSSIHSLAEAEDTGK
jgi:hypothetical protein